MGYCYTKNGLLVCDICGGSGGVRKHRCPFGYCQAIAACPKCRKEKAQAFGKKTHREQGCERLHNEFQAKLAREAELIERGRAIRRSALTVGDRVQVIFESKGGPVGFFMSHQAYDAIPLGAIATPEDYEAFGPLEPAPTVFEHTGRPTKQIFLSN